MLPCLTRHKRGARPQHLHGVDKRPGDPHPTLLPRGEGTGPLGEHGLVTHAVLVGADGHQEQLEHPELGVLQRVDALRQNGGHGATEE